MVGLRDPARMLEFLRNKASDRKLRLFGIYCCRHAKLTMDKRSQKALETVERYADCLRSKSTLSKAKRTANEVLQQFGRVRQRSELIVKWLCHVEVQPNIGPMSKESADDMASRQPRHLMRATRRLAQINQTRILRDIFGNPFHPIVIEPRWRTAEILTIARTLYDDRAFDRLPILADALQDAGCDDAEILGHCRSGGEHVRGCWVVDLLLGRK